MQKTLVVYATRTSKTKDIAELIAEGIRSAETEIRLVGRRDQDGPGLRAQNRGKAGLVLGGIFDSSREGSHRELLP